MSYCPNCGSFMDAAQQYCPNCGAKRPVAGTVPAEPPNPPAPAYAPPPYPPPPPPAQGRGVVAVVIVLIVVLVIAAIAFAALFLISPSEPQGDAVTIDSATVLDEPVGAEPEAGNRIINLRITMTNHGSSDLLLDRNDFELEVGGGERYPATDKVATTLPDTLGPGSTGTFTMAFEVPQDAEPRSVHFDGSFA